MGESERVLSATELKSR